jgi:chromosome segregation ATPase
MEAFAPYYLKAPARPASRREAELEDQFATSHAKLQDMNADAQSAHHDSKVKTDAVNHLTSENQKLKRRLRAAGVDQEQLATIQTKLQQAESDVQSLNQELKFEMEAADRLTKENIELTKKLKAANNETGVMDTLVQEQKIRGDKFEAANCDEKAEMEMLLLGGKKADLPVMMAAPKIEREEGRVDRLEAANFDATEKLQEANKEIGRLQTLIEDEKIMRVQRADDLRVVIQKLILRAGNAEAEVKTLAQKVQRERDRCDQSEAANLDASRHLRDAQHRAECAEARVGEIEREIRELRQEKQEAAKDYEKRIKALINEIKEDENSYAFLEGLLRDTREERARKTEEPPQSPQNLSVAQLATFQDREQTHNARFAAAQELITHLQIAIQDKQTEIQAMEARESALIVENQSLETSKATLVTQAHELQQRLERNGKSVRDALAEIGASRFRFVEEVERNEGAERELRQKLAETNETISKLEENCLYWLKKSVRLEEKLEIRDEHRDLLLEQIQKSEEQNEDVVDKSMDSEDEDASDSGSVSSWTEREFPSAVSKCELSDPEDLREDDKRGSAPLSPRWGSEFELSDYEDLRENHDRDYLPLSPQWPSEYGRSGCEVPREDGERGSPSWSPGSPSQYKVNDLEDPRENYERCAFHAPETHRNGNTSNEGEDEEIQDANKNKIFLAKVKELFQRDLSASRGFIADKITPRVYYRGQHRIKREFNELQSTPRGQRVYEIWNRAREERNATGDFNAYDNFLLDTIRCMDQSEKLWEPRKRGFEDAAEQGDASCPTKRRRYL